MDEDWETLADKDELPPVKIRDINKWEGEDDDDDVKDSWEDEEEKKDEEKSEQSPSKSTTSASAKKQKPNKALKAKLAEQDRLADEEEEKRLANMTPEEKLAEKLRIQKIQEESDLKSALDTFGVSSISGGLDAFNPKTKEEFKEFGATLSWKLSSFKESPYYAEFVEELVRSICCNLPSADIKKVKQAAESLHSEKLKMEKQNAKKPVAKGKGKINLRTETDDIDVYQKYGNDYGNDYDEFM